MARKSYIITILLFIAIPIQLAYLFFKPINIQNNVAGLETQIPSILNSVFFGESRFTLFGYTSPMAEVTLSGQGISSDQTTADSTGYFEFTNRFSPFLPHEICLNAKDQFGRISTPSCLPAFPVKDNVKIGPVIIPPTISLNKPNYYINDEVILTGQTIPNSKIDLSMFTKPSSIPSLLSSSFIKTVEAYSIPQLTVDSDSQGNFSISLPSSSAQDYRIFTQVKYEDSPSANSMALNVKIIPIWMIIIEYLRFFLNIIKSRIIEISIVLEIIYLINYFLNKKLHSYHLITKKNSIVLYNNILPELEEKHPLMIKG